MHHANGVVWEAVSPRSPKRRARVPARRVPAVHADVAIQRRRGAPHREFRRRALRGESLRDDDATQIRLDLRG